jgi:hypothetical protein
MLLISGKFNINIDSVIGKLKKINNYRKPISKTLGNASGFSKQNP